MLENVYLNDIPLDIFMKYFNSKNLAFNEPLQVPKKIRPYRYRYGTNLYLFEYLSPFRFENIIYKFDTDPTELEAQIDAIPDSELDAEGKQLKKEALRNKTQFLLSPLGTLAPYSEIVFQSSSSSSNPSSDIFNKSFVTYTNYDGTRSERLGISGVLTFNGDNITFSYDSQSTLPSESQPISEDDLVLLYRCRLPEEFIQDFEAGGVDTNGEIIPSEDEEDTTDGWTSCYTYTAVPLFSADRAITTQTSAGESTASYQRTWQWNSKTSKWEEVRYRRPLITDVLYPTLTDEVNEEDLPVDYTGGKIYKINSHVLSDDGTGTGVDDYAHVFGYEDPTFNNTDEDMRLILFTDDGSDHDGRIFIPEGTEKIRFCKNELVTEVKYTVDGTPIYLDNEGNEVTVPQSDSNFIQHHELFKQPSGIIYPEEVLPYTVPPNTLCLLTKNGGEMLSAYSYIKDVCNISVIKEKPSDDVSAERSLQSHMYNYFVGLSAGEPKSYTKTITNYKTQDYFDFLNPPVIGIKFDEEKLAEKKYEWVLSNTNLENGIYVTYTYDDMINSVMINPEKRIVYIKDKKISQFPANSAAGTGDGQDSNLAEYLDLLRFTYREVEDMFALNFEVANKDAYYSVNNSEVANSIAFSEDFQIYYRITEKLTTSDKESPNMITPEFYEFPMRDHTLQYSTAEAETFFMPSLNRYIKPGTVYNINDSESGNSPQTAVNTKWMPTVEDFRLRFTDFKASGSTDKQGREVAPRGVFKANRSAMLKKMFLEMFNKISNETYSIENSFIDADAPMKMYIYSNGLYKLFKADTGLQNLALNTKLLIEAKDLKTQITLVSPFSTIPDGTSIEANRQSLDARVDAELAASKQIYSNMSPFQRLIDFNAFGTTEEQAKDEAKMNAIVDYLANEHTESQLHNFDYDAGDPKLTENKVSRISFKNRLIADISYFWENGSTEYFDDYNKFLRPKLYKIYPQENMENAEEEFIRKVFNVRNDKVNEKKVYSSDYDYSNLETIKNEVLNNGKVVL